MTTRSTFSLPRSGKRSAVDNIGSDSLTLVVGLFFLRRRRKPAVVGFFFSSFMVTLCSGCDSAFLGVVEGVVGFDFEAPLGPGLGDLLLKEID